jgi:hypothetical protein
MRKPYQVMPIMSDILGAFAPSPTRHTTLASFLSAGP